MNEYVNQKTTIENIQGIISVLEQKYKLLTIEQLLDAQIKLASLSFTLASEVAKANKEYQLSYWQRKTGEVYNYLKKKAEKIEDKTITDKMAEMLSKEQDILVYEDEVIKNSDLLHKDLALKQVNQMLYTLRQRVDILKNESFNSGNTIKKSDIDNIFK